MKRKLCLCLLAMLLMSNSQAAIPIKASTETQATTAQAKPSFTKGIAQQYKQMLTKVIAPEQEAAKKEATGTGALGVISLLTGLFGFFVASSFPIALVLLALAFILGIAGIQKRNSLKVLAAIGLALGAIGLLILFMAVV